ncbi:MAG: winged helix-turn-helix transcriptional regulator [Nitrospiraceae bacterium]|nr:winged helix-turn-helix transcriptional regulator [Nitrospiraceae bacterium]
MVTLDEKDLKILAILKNNSKLTTNKISKSLMMPITTVHNRIKKLEKNGIIKRYTIDINYKLIGQPIVAYVFVKINYNEINTNPSNRHSKTITHDELIKKIKSINNICSVELVTGDYDLIIKLRVKDLDELSAIITDKLRVIEGIERTDTTIVLSELK